MAIKFRLPEDVREKYALPEWVDYDPNSLMMSEAIHLEDTLGIDPTELGERLSPPEGKRRDMRAWKYVIWLAVKRAGVDVAYDDFDLNLLALRVTSDEAEAEAAEAEGPKETETEDPSTPENSNDDATGQSDT